MVLQTILISSYVDHSTELSSVSWECSELYFRAASEGVAGASKLADSIAQVPGLSGPRCWPTASLKLMGFRLVLLFPASVFLLQLERYNVKVQHKIVSF